MESSEVTRIIKELSLDNNSDVALQLELYAAYLEIKQLLASAPAEIADPDNCATNADSILLDVKAFVFDVLNTVRQMITSEGAKRSDFIQYKSSLRERYSVFDRLGDII